MQISSTKSLLSGIWVGAAQQYFAAFMLVGGNFLFPGPYTFGIVCLVGLFVLTTSCVVIVSRVTTRPFMLMLSGLLSSLVAVGVLFTLAPQFSKAYFLFGIVGSLPASILVCIVAVQQIRRESINGFSTGATLTRSISTIAGEAVVYAIFASLHGTIDACQFIRQQLYVGVAAIVVCTVIALIVDRRKWSPPSHPPNLV